MNKQDARRAGTDTGYDIGLGMPASEWGGGVPSQDQFVSTVFEVEENARQYSPFEVFAHEINSHEEFRAEGLWDAYDDGVGAGARKAFHKRFGR